MLNFTLEEVARKRANSSNLFVAGIDEVGVGSLAGPVMAVAVVLPDQASWFILLDDSKRLTQTKRNHLYKLILANAVAIGVGYATPEEIDAVGIVSARQRAVIRAFRECKKNLGRESLAAVVDDKRLALMQRELGGRFSIFVDKADAKSCSVAAASIVAKVLRDTYMEDVAKVYQNYGFEKHKGYGTLLHFESLKKYGPCPIHRYSFRPIKESKRSS